MALLGAQADGAGAVFVGTELVRDLVDVPLQALSSCPTRGELECRR